MPNKPDESAGKQGERIAKVVARAGLGSRREVEGWIAAGRVAVNGTIVTSPATNVGARDHITVDGEALPARERTRLFLHHKPRGLVTTHSDPQGRPTIFSRLPKGLPRLLSVGRLDINSEGLLLLTNDGGLARVLELPETGWLRRYRVRAHGRVTQAALDTLRAGIAVDGVNYGPIEASLDREQGANVWLTFAMREGKNREVRNVLGHLGLSVNRLIRVSFGPFQLGELAEGAVDEVPTRVLREQIGARIAAEAGADFAGPIKMPDKVRNQPSARHPESRAAEGREPRRTTGPAPFEARLRRSPQSDGERSKGAAHSTPRPKFKPRDHAWREHKPWEERKTPLTRKYRGKRRDNRPAHEEPAGKRAGLLKDRKGRRVLVERVAPDRSASPDVSAQPPRPPKRHGRKRPRDRASGPRPSRPRGR